MPEFWRVWQDQRSSTLNQPAVGDSAFPETVPNLDPSDSDTNSPIETFEQISPHTIPLNKIAESHTVASDYEEYMSLSFEQFRAVSNSFEQFLAVSSGFEQFRAISSCPSSAQVVPK